MSDRNQRGLLILCVLIYAIAGAGRGLAFLFMDQYNGYDYATFHYAVKEAWDGGDPYQTRSLTRRSRQEGTRKKRVYPYFYPPPFLLMMLWTVPLSLFAGSVAMWAVHQLALLAVLLALRRWLDAPLLLLGIVACAMAQTGDNAALGQVNLPVLALVILALWKDSGPAMACAGMIKMAPAIHLVGWAAEGRWRAIGWTAASALGLSILTLPLVDLPTQIRFYTQILPGFSDGDYNGLVVPVTLWANHSLADLINRGFPGPDKHHLSAQAILGSRLLVAGAIAALIPVFRHARGELGRASAYGALMAVMILAPIYTWEHHLIFLILPIVAVGTALHRGLLPTSARIPAIATFVWIALPLPVIRITRLWVPALQTLVEESKLIAVVAIGALSAWAAWRSREWATDGEG